MQTQTCNYCGAPFTEGLPDRVGGNTYKCMKNTHKTHTHTFAPVLAVFLPPLVEEDVEVARVLEEAEVVRRGGGGEDALEVSFPTQLVLRLGQETHVLGCQHVQHGRQQGLTAGEHTPATSLYSSRRTGLGCRAIHVPPVCVCVSACVSTWSVKRWLR